MADPACTDRGQNKFSSRGPKICNTGVTGSSLVRHWFENLTRYRTKPGTGRNTRYWFAPPCSQLPRATPMAEHEPLLGFSSEYDPYLRYLQAEREAQPSRLPIPTGSHLKYALLLCTASVAYFTYNSYAARLVTGTLVPISATLLCLLAALWSERSMARAQTPAV